MKRLRRGELIASVGIVCLIVSLIVPTYNSLLGHLTAWDTFGPAVALQLAALCAALAMVVSALTERSPALPVSTAVWCVPLGLAATIASVVRFLERPDHASSLMLGGWLALVGSLGILVGAWQVLSDERPELYEPASPAPRPRP
ncbi:MAG: hypothetical protein ACYDHN_11265 [Solirubrobacteraceae bacterium]